jgi:DUF917 family protein
MKDGSNSSSSKPGNGVVDGNGTGEAKPEKKMTALEKARERHWREKKAKEKENEKVNEISKEEMEVDTK